MRVSKKPKDPGQVSDERSATRSKGTQEKSLQRQAKLAEKRIEQLETREKPYVPPTMLLDFGLTKPPEGRIILRAEGLSFAYRDGDVLFDGAEFWIENRQRTALVGENGSGKTTLLNLLNEKAPGITCAPRVVFGYYRQQFEQLAETDTVMESAMRENIQPVSFARTILARMLFASGDLGKKVTKISGGERVRLSLVKILLSKANVLLLDEPTNFLDIRSLQALENVLSEYQGTIVFTSHDTRFVEHVATRKLKVGGKKVIPF